MSIRPFTTVEPSSTYVDAERHAGIQEALALILAGRPGYAFFKLGRSVERQNRIAGNGSILLPGCPCGRDDCMGGGRR